MGTLVAALIWLMLLVPATEADCRVPGTEAGSNPVADFTTAEYEASSNPADVVLFLTERGGYGRRTVYQYSLYGGGRLVRKGIDGSRQEVTVCQDVALSEEESKRILDHAVFSGLAEFTPDRLREVVGHKQPIAVDSSTVILELHFLSYERSGVVDKGPLAASIRLSNPRIYSRIYPELGEARALRDLQFLVAEIFADAQPGDCMAKEELPAR